MEELNNSQDNAQHPNHNLSSCSGQAPHEINPATGNLYKLSSAFRAKVSARMKGKKLSEETKQKISKSMTGHKVRIETKVKLSKALVGKARPEEVKQKISATKQANKNKDI